MKLATAPAKYDSGDQARVRAAVEDADRQNLKRGVAASFLLMTKPDGTVGRLTIDSSGTPIWTALP
jgi:hypothetical protein